MPIDLTKIQSASDIAHAEALKVINKVSHIVYDDFDNAVKYLKNYK